MNTLNTLIEKLTAETTHYGYPLDEEQLACLRDPGRVIEAIGMLNDMHSRVGSISSELLDEALRTISGGKRFTCSWGAGYVHANPKLVGVSFFTEENGYSNDQQARVLSLQIGESVQFDDEGSHCIARGSDGEGPQDLDVIAFTRPPRAASSSQDEAALAARLADAPRVILPGGLYALLDGVLYHCAENLDGTFDLSEAYECDLHRGDDPDEMRKAERMLLAATEERAAEVLAAVVRVYNLHAHEDDATDFLRKLGELVYDAGNVLKGQSASVAAPGPVATGFDRNYPVTMRPVVDGYVGRSKHAGLLRTSIASDADRDLLPGPGDGGDLMTGPPSIEVVIGTSLSHLNWADAYNLGFALIRTAGVAHYG